MKKPFDKREGIEYNTICVVMRGVPMQLDLKRIAREPGSTLPFAFQMDLSQLEWNGEHPVSQPVTVEGSVRNMAGGFFFQATMVYTPSLVCGPRPPPLFKGEEGGFGALLADGLEDGGK